jgi:hypothetical protein
MTVVIVSPRDPFSTADHLLIYLAVGRRAGGENKKGLKLLKNNKDSLRGTHHLSKPSRILPISPLAYDPRSVTLDPSCVLVDL